MSKKAMPMTVYNEGGGEQLSAAADPPPSNGAKIKTVNDQQTKQRGLLEVARPPWRSEWCGEGGEKEKERRETCMLTNAERARLTVCHAGVGAT